MPLKIELEERVEEFRVGKDPVAVIRYVQENAGMREDAAAESVGANRKDEKAQRRRFEAGVWGRIIRGWENVDDAASKPVPFEAPKPFVEGFLANLKANGEKFPADVAARHAQNEWIYTVIRGFPPGVKIDLQFAAQAASHAVSDALGN